MLGARPRRIYVGSSSRRASRAYGNSVLGSGTSSSSSARGNPSARTHEGIGLMRKLKHLPLDKWPMADIEAFTKAYEPGDIFERHAGPGRSPSRGHPQDDQTAYRRWLGFLTEHYPDDLLKPPADRITPERVRAFIEHLSAEIRATSVANAVDNLCYAARLIAPKRDWRWLAALKGRLAARAQPEDRFDRLVPPWQTLRPRYGADGEKRSFAYLPQAA